MNTHNQIGQNEQINIGIIKVEERGRKFKKNSDFYMMMCSKTKRNADGRSRQYHIKQTKEQF